MLVVLGLITLLLVVLLVVFRRDPNLPPIGKVSWLPEVIDFGKEPVEYLKEARRIHGDVFTLRFSPKTSWHFVTSRSGIRQLLSGTDRVYEFDEAVRQIVGPIFGDALFENADFNASWRKIAHSGFNNRNQVDYYVRYLKTEVHLSMEQWAKKDSIDLWDALEELTIRMESYAFVGSDVTEDFFSKICPRVKYVVHAAAHPLVAMFPNLPFGEPKKARRVVNELNDLYEEVLEQAEARKQEIGNDGERLRLYENYAQTIVHSPGSEKFPRRLFASHMTAMVFAGVINTAFQTAWSVAHLATDSKMREKLRGELDGKTMPEKDHISFTEKIMRETSRRYCPIYSIRWAKSEPIEIEGKIIPKGEFVVGTFPTVHFDPDLWPEPEKFDPERFTTPEQVQRFISEAAYVGFGAGRHRCAGEKFSLASQNDIISHLFANYDVELVGMKDVPKPTWAGVDSSPVPVQRIRVKVTPRKH